MEPQTPDSFTKNPNKVVRCFLGLPFEFAAVLESIPRSRSLDADFRYTDPALWHLTLAFMPNLPESDIPDLIVRCTAVLQAFRPIQTFVSGVDAFPSQSRPEVLWLGLSPNKPFFEIAEALRPCLPKESDNRFHPHITFARIRRRGISSASRAELQSVFSEHRISIPCNFSSVCLYESFLESAGPRYVIRHQWS